MRRMIYSFAGDVAGLSQTLRIDSGSVDVDSAVVAIVRASDDGGISRRRVLELVAARFGERLANRDFGAEVRAAADELGIDLDESSANRCPHCRLVMSVREKVEQGACNECCDLMGVQR